MKSFILGMLLCTTSWANVSINDANNIFNRLKSISGIPQYVSLHIRQSEEINAGSNMYNVYINTGMLKFLKNQNELALILGHELAHILNQSYNKGGSYSDELGADSLGAWLMQKGGYNKCEAIQLWKRMPRLAPDGIHPSNKERYGRLSTGC